MATTKNKKKTPSTRKPGITKNRAPIGRSQGAGRSQPKTEKLSVLTPSGRKDESFFELVHEVARQIPRGRVTSYGAIAAVLGTRMSARMVGWAMNACHSAKKPVPAHRVVNRNGLLTGKHHFNPPSQMEKLLKKEGIKVKDDKIVGFTELYWDPATELY